MTKKLTQGFITALWRGERIKKPVVQILNHQRFDSPRSHPLSSEYYQLIVWDGTLTTNSATLYHGINNLITAGKLQNNSIIRLDKYVCKGAGGKKVLVIYKFTTLMDGNIVGKKIRNLVVGGAGMEALTPGHFATPIASPIIGHCGNVAKPQENTNIIPISRLIPCNDVWFIKARLIQKGPIYTVFGYNIFTMDLIDASGAIRAYAERGDCDRFHDMMKLNEVYLISKCSITPAIRKFTTIPHDFELKFNKSSVVVHCDDDDCLIPTTYFSFTALSEFKNIAVGSFVDIVGICISVSDFKTEVFKIKTGLRDVKKREITLVDMSSAPCSVMLCNNQSQNVDFSNNPVVTITGVKVFEYKGSKIALASEISHLRLNPDLQEAHQLRRWYDSLDSNHEFSSV